MLSTKQLGLLLVCIVMFLVACEPVAHPPAADEARDSEPSAVEASDSELSAVEASDSEPSRDGVLGAVTSEGHGPFVITNGLCQLKSLRDNSITYPDSTWNIFFVPSKDLYEFTSGPNATQENTAGYEQAITSLSNGMLSNAAFHANADLFEVFVLDDCSVDLAEVDLETGCPKFEVPDNELFVHTQHFSGRQIATAFMPEMLIVLHDQAELKDCAQRNTNGTLVVTGGLDVSSIGEDVQETHLTPLQRALVHELGHSLGVPDEYRGAGNYWHAPPLMFKVGNEGEDVSLAQQKCKHAQREIVGLDDDSECELFSVSVTSNTADVNPIEVYYYRSENDQDIMTKFGGTEVREFGRADWKVIDNTLKSELAPIPNPGASVRASASISTVVTTPPDIYAPDSFDPDLSRMMVFAPEPGFTPIELVAFSGDGFQNLLVTAENFSSTPTFTEIVQNTVGIFAKKPEYGPWQARIQDESNLTSLTTSYFNPRHVHIYDTRNQNSTISHALIDGLLLQPGTTSQLYFNSISMPAEYQLSTDQTIDLISPNNQQFEFKIQENFQLAPSTGGWQPYTPMAPNEFDPESIFGSPGVPSGGLESNLITQIITPTATIGEEGFFLQGGTVLPAGLVYPNGINLLPGYTIPEEGLLLEEGLYLPDGLYLEQGAEAPVPNNP